MATKKSDETVTVKASDLEGESIRSLTGEQVKGLKGTQLSKLSPEQVAMLSPEQVNALSGEQLAQLSPEAQAKLPADQQGRMIHQKAGEKLNPEEVDLAPGYNPETAPAPGEPLKEKTPHYAPGAVPQFGATRYAPPVGQGRTDTRVPPENVSVTENNNLSTGASSDSREPKSGQAPESAAQLEANAQQLSAAVTPADVGLPRPELIAGRHPLPEEDPTPSIVPIPPPGPKRVA